MSIWTAATSCCLREDFASDSGLATHTAAGSVLQQILDSSRLSAIEPKNMVAASGAPPCGGKIPGGDSRRMRSSWFESGVQPTVTLALYSCAGGWYPPQISEHITPAKRGR